MLVCWDGKSTDFTESMKTLTRGTSTRYKGYEYQVHQHEVSRMSPRFFFLCFCPFLILILSLWDNLKHARTLLTITDMHAEHQSESCQVNSYFWEEVLGENDVTKKNYLQFMKRPKSNKLGIIPHHRYVATKDNGKIVLIEKSEI